MPFLRKSKAASKAQQKTDKATDVGKSITSGNNGEPVPVPVAPSKSSSTPAAPPQRSWFKFVSWLPLLPSGNPSPGPFEEVNREISEVIPDFITGVRFQMTRPVNNNIAMSHQIEAGSPTQKPGYLFGANFASEKGLIMTQLKPAGLVSARAQYQLHPSIMAKLNWQIAPKPNPSIFQQSLDVNVSDFSAQVKVANGGYFGLQYLQALTPSISAGAEVFRVGQGQDVSNGATVVLRRRTPTDSAALTWSSMKVLSASYVHRVNEKVSVGTQLDVRTDTRDSMATVGYHYDLRQARVKGLIDSRGRIGCLLEEKLAPGVSFYLSGEIHHRTNMYNFGFGITIGAGEEAQ